MNFEVDPKIAASFGLKVKVARDDDNCAFHIQAALAERFTASCAVNEEAVYSARLGTDAFADLLLCELENLHDRLVDDTLAMLQRIDRRQRTFTLSEEDKNVLYDMLKDAELERLRDFHRAEQNMKKIDEYHALLGRLFR